MRMAKERIVRGLRLHEQPVSGRHDKFAITEEEAWFLPFEGNTRALDAARDARGARQPGERAD